MGVLLPWLALDIHNAIFLFPPPVYKISPREGVGEAIWGEDDLEEEK